MGEHWDETDAEPRVSHDLAPDLASLFGAVELRVPPAVNERILSRARARIVGSSARHRPLLLRWAGAAAAAAAAVVLVAAWLNVSQPRRPSQTSAIPADVDGNGQVNILDALVLARRVEAHQPGATDVNQDGISDRGDVDSIAMLAVGLERGGAR
jgi:hypothetical protein